MTIKKTGRRSGGGADMVPNMAYYARHLNLGGGANMVPEQAYYAEKLVCCGGGGGMYKPSCGAMRSGGGARVARVAHAKPTVEYATSTFYVGEYKVKVRHPISKSASNKVYAVLDKHHPGSSLKTVNRALAKIGACFAPWSDGSPGYYSTPRHPVYK